MSCLVCETEAHGQHFGIRCCRACAAFFRRTLTMNLRYKCRFEKRCEVSFNKRYSCRSCRFDKCLRVGMRKEMVQSKSENEKDSSTETDSVGHSPETSYHYYQNNQQAQPQHMVMDPKMNQVPHHQFSHQQQQQQRQAIQSDFSPEEYQPNGDLSHHQSAIQPYHQSVIEEVPRHTSQQSMAPMHHQQHYDYSYTDLSSSEEQQTPPFGYQTAPTPVVAHLPQNSETPPGNVWSTSAQQVTADLHVNVQNRITPIIDALFDQTTPVNNISSNFFGIPLTLCQQALLAYQEHNKQWPASNVNAENQPLDMEDFMRNHCIEIEHIARFCMSIKMFAQLPKQQKWIIFKHFWIRFYELDRCYVTCQQLGYNIDDERTVTLNGQIVNFGIAVVKLENISDMDATQVKNFLKGSMDKFRLIFVNPFKKLQPTEFELMYMMMSIMWSVGNLPGITDETRATAEKVEIRLAEDLHSYYAEKYDNTNPNYAGRITRLSSIASAVDEITERRREDSQVSKTFNIFKSDFFFSDLTDFPV